MRRMLRIGGIWGLHGSFKSNFRREGEPAVGCNEPADCDFRPPYQSLSERRSRQTRNLVADFPQGISTTLLDVVMPWASALRTTIRTRYVPGLSVKDVSRVS